MTLSFLGSISFALDLSWKILYSMLFLDIENQEFFISLLFVRLVIKFSRNYVSCITIDTCTDKNKKSLYNSDRLIGGMDLSFLELFVIFIMTVIVIMFIRNHYGEVEYVKSNIDGRSYLVRKLPDMQEASDYLADVNMTLIKLVRHMMARYPVDENSLRY